MNSSVSEWLFSNIGTTTGVGTIRWKKFAIEELLVIYPDYIALMKINELVNNFKENRMPHLFFKQKINILINRLYKLNEGEIKYIQKQ